MVVGVNGKNNKVPAPRLVVCLFGSVVQMNFACTGTRYCCCDICVPPGSVVAKTKMDSSEDPIEAGIQQEPPPKSCTDCQEMMSQIAKMQVQLESRKKIYFQMLSDMVILVSHKSGDAPENVRKLMLCGDCHAKELKIKDKDIEIAKLNGHVMFLEGILEILKQSANREGQIPKPHVGSEAMV